MPKIDAMAGALQALRLDGGHRGGRRVGGVSGQTAKPCTRNASELWKDGTKARVAAYSSFAAENPGAVRRDVRAPHAYDSLKDLLPPRCEQALRSCRSSGERSDGQDVDTAAARSAGTLRTDGARADDRLRPNRRRADRDPGCAAPRSRAGVLRTDESRGPRRSAGQGTQVSRSEAALGRLVSQGRDA